MTIYELYVSICVFEQPSVFECVFVYERGSLVSDSKELAGKVGDLDLIPWWGRSPGEGNGKPLHYSCLGNLMDRGYSPWGRKRVGHNLATKQQFVQA